jgi:hypothetical protein
LQRSGLLLVALLLKLQTKHEMLAVLALDYYYMRHYQVIVAAINITHPVKHDEPSVARMLH